MNNAQTHTAGKLEQLFYDHFEAVALGTDDDKTLFNSSYEEIRSELFMIVHDLKKNSETGIEAGNGQ